MATSGGDDGVAVFVYGTLRPHRTNWAVVAPFCRRHEPATLPGFALYDLAYPCVVPVVPTDHDGPDHPGGPATAVGSGVRGDLLWLEPGRVAVALDRLDAFEGVDTADPGRSYYRRERQPTVTGEGRPIEAWVYVPGADLLAQVDLDRRVPGDDWAP